MSDEKFISEFNDLYQLHIQTHNKFMLKYNQLQRLNKFQSKVGYCELKRFYKLRKKISNKFYALYHQNFRNFWALKKLLEKNEENERKMNIQK